MSQRIECPECGSKDVLYNEKRDEHVCKDCGHQFESEEPFVHRRIFLSYGHDEHAALAERLKTDLAARGHEVWFDLDRLKPGGDWEVYIEEGIEWVSAAAADGRVVLLMTPHSVRRPDGYALNEIARARQRSLSVVPVMVVWCEPPLSICRIQWLDMQDCVPIDQREERYEAKFHRLREALEQDRLDFGGTQARLINLLEPLPFDADIEKHLDRFTGREWVFDAIDKWLGNPNASRVFWLQGAPGVGKTAIAAWLCRNRREVAAFHLCQHGHRQKADPRATVTSIAYQLSTQLPDYQERLSGLNLELLLSEADATTLFDRLIVQPLSASFPRPINPVIILIDGLDEATEAGRNELAWFISTEWRSTPDWLRLVVTSRPEPEVTHPLQALSPYVLDASEPRNQEDIRQFLRRELEPFAQGEQAIEGAAEAILDRSEGLFLYVEYVRQELAAGRLSLDRLEEFPQGLGGVYASFFARQFPDKAEFKERILPALQIIAAARVPLALTQMGGMLGWDEYGESNFVYGVGSLFSAQEQGIQPFHRSVMEWLADRTTAGRHFFVSETEGHKRIADACWREFRTEPLKTSVYCRAHLAAHLRQLERWSQLLLLVTSPHLGLIKVWVDTGDQIGAACIEDLIEHADIAVVHKAALATQLARIRSHRGEYDEAEEWLQYAVDRTSWWRGRRVRAVAMHELGTLHLYKGDAALAAHYYRDALRLCLWGLPVHRDEAVANRIGLALIACRQYEWQKATRRARRAVREAKAIGEDRHAVAAQRILAFALEELGEYEETESTLHQALALSETARSDIEQALVMVLLGGFHYVQAVIRGQPCKEAMDWLVRAAELAERISSPCVAIDAKLCLARCATAEARTQDAIELLREVAPLLPPNSHPELTAAFRLESAVVSHQNDNMQQAEADYTSAFSLGAEHAMYCVQARAMVGLGALQWHAGRERGAQAAWQEARRLASLRNSPRGEALTEVGLSACRASPVSPPP